jgi:hypothetical protein
MIEESPKAFSVSGRMDKPMNVCVLVGSLRKASFNGMLANALISLAPSSMNLGICQSALKFDPVSASNFDPFERRVLTVALVSSELAGIAETRRARVV